MRNVQKTNHVCLEVLNFTGMCTLSYSTKLIPCLKFFFIAAVRRNKLVARATRADVENVVQLWLRCASDRSGGRLARSRHAIENHDSDSE